MDIVVLVANMQPNRLLLQAVINNHHNHRLIEMVISQATKDIRVLPLITHLILITLQSKVEYKALNPNLI
jgi:exonuclease V gamma subunit